MSAVIKVRTEQEQNEPFSEDKLFISIYKCLSHRKDAAEASRALSDTIIRFLLPSKSGMVEIDEIRTLALQVLKRFDQAAHTYYKAHHK